MKKSAKSINRCQSVIRTFYDIVKAHGGELSVRTPLEKVETREGEGLPDEASAQSGSEFVIKLPIV